MPLTEKQIGVLKGMILGASVALCIAGLGSYLNPFDYQEYLNPIDKFNVAVLWCLIPAVFLAASIGRLAKHRNCSKLTGKSTHLGVCRTLSKK